MPITISMKETEFGFQKWTHDRIEENRFTP
jgi:hypothetical protein